jgi:hypothetical protein
MLSDLTALFRNCIEIYMLRDPGAFRMTVILGVGLAALSWALCSVYTRLWNKRFRITLTHHALCAFASVCTLLFTILFASLQYTKEAALVRIENWQTQLKSDSVWGDRTFAKAYERVQDLGTEDFSNAPPPGSPNSIVPMNYDETKQTVASLYANEACHHFDGTCPFLSKVVWSSPGVPADTIIEDVNAWMLHDRVYPASRAIDIAGLRVREGLEPQAPRVVYLAKLAVVGLFVLIQMIPFGLIGWAAYRDIKVRL